MKTNNSDIVIPNGEKIKGSNLLSKYVAKICSLCILIKLILNIQEYLYFNRRRLYNDVEMMAI